MNNYRTVQNYFLINRNRLSLIEQTRVNVALDELNIRYILFNALAHKFSLVTIEDFVKLITLDTRIVKEWLEEEYPKDLANILGSNLEMVLESLNVTDQALFDAKTDDLYKVSKYIVDNQDSLVSHKVR